MGLEFAFKYKEELEDVLDWSLDNADEKDKKDLEDEKTFMFKYDILDFASETFLKYYKKYLIFLIESYLKQEEYSAVYLTKQLNVFSRLNESRKVIKEKEYDDLIDKYKIILSSREEDEFKRRRPQERRKYSK